MAVPSAHFNELTVKALAGIKYIYEDYQKRANEGDVLAQCQLGSLLTAQSPKVLQIWYGDEERTREGIEWLRKAALQNNIEAQWKLGVALTTLLYSASAKDKKEGSEWLRKAAELGNIDAQFSLAHFLIFSSKKCLGIESEEEGIKWLRKAEEAGNAAAQTQFGMIYLEPEQYERYHYIRSYFNKDARKAVEYFRKAAEQGFAAAQYNLGYCLKDGRGIEKNEKEAMEWFLRSSINGGSGKKELMELRAQKNSQEASKTEIESISIGDKDPEKSESDEIGLLTQYKSVIGLRKLSPAVEDSIETSHEIPKEMAAKKVSRQKFE